MAIRCVCPGSYDPITLGHLDVIQRATKLADEVIVAIVSNPAKSGMFTIDQRVELAQAAVAEQLPERVDQITVQAAGHGLLVDFCQTVQADIVVKGLRSGTDFAYELPMALMNKKLSGLETVFLPGAPELEHISSSLVKEVAQLGGDVQQMLPEVVHRAVLARVR